MKKFIIILSIIFGSTSLLAFAETPEIQSADLPASDCSSTEKTNSDLANRIATLESISKDLQRLHAGELTHTSMEALFTVNLDDQSAVEKRVSYLQSIVGDDASETPVVKSEVSKTPCLTDSKADKEKFKQLADLEENVAEQRLSFLILPTERRIALIQIQEQARFHKEALKNIKSEKKNATKQAVVVDQNLKEAEHQAQKASTSALRDIASERAILETVRKDIADLTLLWTNVLEKSAEENKQLSTLVSRESSVLTRHDADVKEYKGSYELVLPPWRKLVDELLKSMLSSQSRKEIPSLPTVNKTVIDEQTESAVKEYNDAYAAASKERDALLVLQERMQSEVEKPKYRLFLTTGRLRAQLLNQVLDQGDRSALKLNSDYTGDLARELRLIPYRPIVLIQNYSYTVRELMSKGISGLVVLARSFLLLVFFFVLPFLVYSLLNRFSVFLDEYRNKLVRTQIRKGGKNKTALWIKRINPYLPWLMMFIATRAARSVVVGTFLEDLAAILPYFEYFFFYRIFKIALRSSVVSATSSLDILRNSSQDLSNKIESTGVFIGIFFLISAYLLQVAETVARKALFYHLLLSGIYWLTPIVLAVAAYWWRKETAVSCNRDLPKYLAKKCADLCCGKSAIIFCLPVTLLLIVTQILKRLYALVSEIDSAKRISAQLFRRKLESAANTAKKSISNVQPIDPEYLSYFDFYKIAEEEFLITPSNIPFDEIQGTISSWVNGTSKSHALAIQGDKGVGKSSTLRKIADNNSSIDTHYLSIPRKIVHADEWLAYLGEQIGADLSGGVASLSTLDSKISKKIIIIDECQNLFLGYPGGFDAFYQFAKLLTTSTKNVFWCVALNKYSWVYLKAVTLGSQYFGRTFPIGEWSDADIRDLILIRHEKSGYDLEFDPIIFAMDRQDGGDSSDYIQERFFQLLWEQSRGNPRIAMKMWLSSLTQKHGKSLKVGLPALSPINPLAGLTDEEKFVVSSIVRHENLTAEECLVTTNLSEGSVSHALQVGREKGFLNLNEVGQYRVKPDWQVAITQQLLGKNYLYE